MTTQEVTDDNINIDELYDYKVPDEPQQNGKHSYGLGGENYISRTKKREDLIVSWFEKQDYDKHWNIYPHEQSDFYRLMEYFPDSFAVVDSRIGTQDIQTTYVCVEKSGLWRPLDLRNPSGLITGLLKKARIRTFEDMLDYFHLELDEVRGLKRVDEAYWKNFCDFYGRDTETGEALPMAYLRIWWNWIRNRQTANYMASFERTTHRNLTESDSKTPRYLYGMLNKPSGIIPFSSGRAWSFGVGDFIEADEIKDYLHTERWLIPEPDFSLLDSFGEPKHPDWPAFKAHYTELLLDRIASRIIRPSKAVDVLICEKANWGKDTLVSILDLVLPGAVHHDPVSKGLTNKGTEFSGDTECLTRCLLCFFNEVDKREDGINLAIINGITADKPKVELKGKNPIELCRCGNTMLIAGGLIAVYGSPQGIKERLPWVCIIDLNNAQAITVADREKWMAPDFINAFRAWLFYRAQQHVNQNTEDVIDPVIIDCAEYFVKNNVVQKLDELLEELFEHDITIDGTNQDLQVAINDVRVLVKDVEKSEKNISKAIKRIFKNPSIRTKDGVGYYMNMKYKPGYGPPSSEDAKRERMRQEKEAKAKSSSKKLIEEWLSKGPLKGKPGELGLVDHKSRDVTDAYKKQEEYGFEIEIDGINYIIERTEPTRGTTKIYNLAEIDADGNTTPLPKDDKNLLALPDPNTPLL